MALSRGKVIQALAGILLSGGLLTWMAFEVEWHSVADELRAANFWYLILTTLILLGHYALRAIRWKYLLAGDAPPFISRWNSLLVGNFATYVLPLRAGEFLRPLYLSRTSGHSFPTAFASIVIERFFDLAMVLLSFGIVLMFVEGLPQWVYSGAGSFAVLAVAILAFMVAGSLVPRQILSLTETMLKPLPRRISGILLRFASDLLDGVAVLHDMRRLVGTLLFTVAVWVSCYVQFYTYFLMFGLDPSIVVSTTTAVLIALAVALPSAPGLIGVYQAACLGSFAVFGLPQDVAAAYSIVTHVHQFVFVILAGTVVLSRANLSLRQLRSEEAH